MRSHPGGIWPFRCPRESVAITLRQIVQERRPILLATHEQDDSWQFLDGSDAPRMEDAVVVALDEIYALDSSIAALADLPAGWQAWRVQGEEAWRRAPMPA